MSDILFAFALILAFIITSVGIGLGLYLLFDKGVTAYRRKKYPIYFVGYDAALKRSFEYDAEFNKRMTAINHDRSLYEMQFECGHCTEEEFDKNMQELHERFKDFCMWRKACLELVNDAYKQVDNYAREHKLKWGFIY